MSVKREDEDMVRVSVARVCGYCTEPAKWITSLVTGELLCNGHACEHLSASSLREVAEVYFRLTDKRFRDYMEAIRNI